MKATPESANDYSHLVGKDELGFAHLLHDYKPAPSGEAQQKFLANATKYSLLTQEDDSKRHLSRCKINDDCDVVAIWDRGTDTVATVMRNLEALVELEGGKVFRQYHISAILVWGKGTRSDVQDAALAHISDMRTQVEFTVARTIEGFGDGGSSLQAALDEPSANPFAPIIDPEDDPGDSIEDLAGMSIVYVPGQ